MTKTNLDIAEVLIASFRSEAAGKLGALDAELRSLAMVVGAAKDQADRVVAQIAAQAEQISDAICEADGDSPGPAADRLLTQIANLPSGDTDPLAGAVESIDEYRKALAVLSRSIAKIGAPAPRRR